MVAAESTDLDEVGAEGDERAVGLGVDVGEAEVEDHLVMVWLISGVAKLHAAVCQDFSKKLNDGEKWWKLIIIARYPLQNFHVYLFH